MQVFKVHHPGSHDLGADMVKIPGLVIAFSVQHASHVFVSGSVGIQHRKLPLSGSGDTKYAIGIGARLRYKNEDGDREWIRGAKWGPNVTGPMHYVIIPLSGYITVNPGNHEISFWACAHTDAPGHYAYPAEIMGATDSDSPGGTKDPYNQMIVRIEKISP